MSSLPRFRTALRRHGLRALVWPLVISQVVYAAQAIHEQDTRTSGRDVPDPEFLVNPPDPLDVLWNEASRDERFGSHPQSIDHAEQRRWLAEFDRSGFVDTLRTVLGWPVQGSELLTDPSLHGRATSSTGGVALNPTGLDPISLRATAAHEAAHLLQQRLGARLGPQWRNIPPALPGSYAATEAEEQQAEAFAGAFVLLQLSSPAPSALAQLDSIVPGTARALRWLLTHPTYARHPWRTAPPELADGTLATPVRPPWDWAEVTERETIPALARQLGQVASVPGHPARRLAGLAAEGMVRLRR